jgi:hypothetical protein
MVVLTAFFLGENVNPKTIIWTLVIGFTLQLGFISDQLKRKKPGLKIVNKHIK